MPRKRAAVTEDDEKDDRAARKRMRTQWRTGATEKDKKKALNLAMGRLGGKKYSWMDQAASTTASARKTPVTSEGEVTASSTAEQQPTVNDADKKLEEELEEELEKQLERELEEELEKELEKEFEKDTDEPITKDSTPSATKGGGDNHKSHLPTPEASSSPQSVASMDSQVLAVESRSEGHLPTEQPANKPSKKRKRGSKEEPIAISSREASPIVISSRDGSPAAPQTPKAKKAKKAQTPVVEEELVDELEEAFAEEEEKEELYHILEYAWAFMTI